MIRDALVKDATGDPSVFYIKREAGSLERVGVTVSKQVQAAMASGDIVRQIWDKVKREPREITKAACDTALIQVVGPKGSGKTTFVLDTMKRKN